MKIPAWVLAVGIICIIALMHIVASNFIQWLIGRDPQQILIG